MTSYYFAARYSRNPEMRECREQLLAALPSALVTSRWIDCHNGEVEGSFTPETLAAETEQCWKYGLADVEDLMAAEAIVTFTGNGGGGKGGRHVEHGMAMGAHHRIIVVGPREHIFHCDPRTEVYDSWLNFLEHEVAVAS